MNTISQPSPVVIRHRWRTAPIAIRILSIALSAVAIPGNAQDVTTGRLETAAVVREVARLERLYDGTVEAVNQGTVSAQTTGRIAEVLYDVNDYVKAGAPIVRFTDVEQQAVLGQAEASLKEATARQLEARQEYRRASDLYVSGAVSKQGLDQARAARDATVARVKAAQSAVESAKQGVEYTLVRAPYAGIVTERLAEVGESVTVGTPLMSGLSLEQLRVVVDLPQQVMTLVRANREATVLTDEGRVSSTEVTIFPFADTTTNTFRVRANLPTGQFGLYPGMFVKVAFGIGESERLLIPSTAVLRRSEVTAVYVVSDTGNVRLRQVRIGNNFADRIEVLAGLVEGERVAVRPVLAAMQAKSSGVPDRVK
ncbi:MAG: efflux RND transporter periplasmic adaptor subunit [Gammaproteobacteria bacterium]|jgi:RND family efflux transporter MFP subunit|nr:efflux RND transporter periplasmic adaptor subunit [Gammaproteobacteria bacterium]MDH3804717.1 efflux RND transporter periplasmic adaptor subunit [Gammaproteobacteria bacterium]